MAFGCLEDYDNRFETMVGNEVYKQPVGSRGLGSQGHPGIFAGQPKNEKRLKVKASKATGSSAGATINTSYPQTDYSNLFYGATATGTAYTAGSGITVTSSNNSLSNCYTLTDALNTK